MDYYKAWDYFPVIIFQKGNRGYCRKGKNYEIYAELVYVVEKSQTRDKNRFALTLFLSDIQVIPYDGNAAQEYGYIRQICNKKEYLLGICPGNNYRIGIFCLCGVLFLIKIFH